ncbi:DUF2934 domain-containing protein [Acidithiobacillus sp.]|uniref:DUF2934 domain-containing protein n=1 Tax=Acidithiobacillus sp. TaxID=1872118 RepID=UPI002608A2C5|nr:DUF2934 domain-containing protein [Acidithiobacillus sp.]
MVEEQPKKRVTRSTEVSADPKAAPARRATAPDAAAVPKPRAARARKSAGEAAPVKMLPSAGRSKSPAVSAADRQHMIAERAYYLAEARSFAGSDCQADWYAAEAWIDAQLST